MFAAVRFDKVMLEGTLAGLTIPSQTIICPTQEDAERLFRFYSRVEQEEVLLKDAVTGNRFGVERVELVILR